MKVTRRVTLISTLVGIYCACLTAATMYCVQLLLLCKAFGLSADFAAMSCEQYGDENSGYFISINLELAFILLVVSVITGIAVTRLFLWSAQAGMPATPSHR